MRAYLIPGLGTDGRIFKNLLTQFNFDEVFYLDFREELCKSCSGMADYAKEISKEIEGTGKAIILNNSLNEIKNTSVKMLSGTLNRIREKPTAVVLDGTAKGIVGYAIMFAVGVWILTYPIRRERSEENE